MLAIGLGIAMAMLDSSIANVALPTMSKELGATPADSVWIINAYQLAIVVALLPLASLGEHIGYRPVYLAGLVFFTVGSFACSQSGNLAVLVASRAVEGLGAAGIMSVNGALVRFTYPRALLGRGVGLNALVLSIAAALGPTIASAILAVGPWEWLFAVNVPIGIVNILIASRALPDSDRSGDPFDWTSAFLNALMFGSFFISVDIFSRAKQVAMAGVLLAAALVAGVILFRRELKAPQPLVPIDLMRNPVFSLSVLTSVCSFAAYMLAFVALPFYFQTALHRDPVETGFLMTPWPVATGLAAPLAGRLSDRISSAILGAFGLGVLAIGMVFLATLPEHATILRISWPMALCGLGFGFFQAPNNRTFLSSAPLQRAGAASGMLAVARLLGLTTGATLSALIFRFVPNSAESTALLTGSVLGATAAIISLARLRGQMSATASSTSNQI
jgi:MFS transporter, DHA2 family, multidrug resistance protein